tara:strand:+ start:70 stop:930 length:861 start_codon:yes stop_codon:yes gene_type:complete
MIVSVVLPIQKQPKKDRLNVLRVMLVLNLIKVAPNVKFVKQECLVMSPVPIVTIAKLVNTVKVKKTTVLKLLIQRLVLIAQRGLHQVLGVPSAKPVGRGRTAMGASLVTKVITATAVTLLRSRVEIAQPVTTVTTLARVLVCHAVQVNSTIRRVLLNVNPVLKIPILVTKAEHQVAYPATTVRPRKKAVPNAIESHAKRAPIQIKIPLTTNAKTVHKVGNRKRWMPPCAHNANSAAQPQKTEVVYALNVSWENLGAKRVNVLIAQRVITKMSTVQNSARSARKIPT